MKILSTMSKRQILLKKEEYEHVVVCNHIIYHDHIYRWRFIFTLLTTFCIMECSGFTSSCRVPVFRAAVSSLRNDRLFTAQMKQTWEGMEETQGAGKFKTVSHVNASDSVLSSQDSIKDQGTPETIQSENPKQGKSLINSIQWDVYVCESKQSKDRGSGATMGAFLGLAPSHLVSVKPAIIHKPKGKGPNVRCIERQVYSVNNELIRKSNPRSFEVNNVDSVEKVHRILTKHMNIKVVKRAKAFILYFIISFVSCFCYSLGRRRESPAVSQIQL